MEDYADNPKKNMYFIREGMDHYKDIPLYRVESTPESEIEYVGEWTESKADAEIELDEMTERANKHLKKGYEGYEDLYRKEVIDAYDENVNNVLSPRLEKQFQEWKADGNVGKFPDGYATQDAQWTNRIKTLNDLRRYFYKEFIKGTSDDYETGGEIQKANVGLLLAGASLLQQRQAQKQGQRSKWEDRGMDYRQPQYYYPAPQPAQPQPTQPQNPMGQVDQQQLMNALMMSKGKFATGGMPEMNDEVTLGFTHYYTIRGNYQEAKDYADNLKTQHPRWDVIVTEDNNNFYILVRTPIKMGNRVYGEGGNVGQTVKYKHWSGDIRTGVVLGMTKDGDYDVQYGTSHVLVKPNEIIEMHKRGGLPNKNWKVKSYESADGDIYYVQNGKKIYRQGDIKITSINQAEKLAKELNNDLSTNKSVTFYLKKSLLHGGEDYSTGGGSPFYHIDNLFEGYKTKEILPNQYIVYDLETPIAEHLGSIKRYFQTYEINNETNKFARGGYPTGRAWTREHYHDNDAEDYEVDPRKRKVGARNRKFMAGGFTPNGYVTIIFNEKPHHFSAEYINGQIEDIDLYSGDYAQDLANFIEKEFDEWLETAPKDYQSMYYGEYDEPAIYSKSGAIDQAYEYIEQDLIDMVKSGKKAVLDIDKGDFVEAFYAKGGNIFKSFEDFGKWFMGSRKQYPTGRAWTREHYHDNDDEDYEVDPKKRKVRARNRKYDVGGLTDGERYPRRADDTGKGINEGYVVETEMSNIDEDLIFETEEGLLNHLRSLNWEDADGNRSQDITDDDDLLEYFYNEDYYYWTQWDNSEIEDQGYYYTADGEEVEINARGGYPTGRAWTREHYHDNDDEDYEIDPNKRKVRARNRKYSFGGGIGEEVYIYEDIEAPDSRTVLIGDEVDEYIEEWNETMQTNYANWKEFNEGEEYYRILPLEEFKRGGNIFRSLEDFGRWFKGQSRSYPTGRAWTREHYHDNDAEDYEVDPNKRKVRARNRKYNVGGKTEKRYIILSPDGFPIYHDQTFTEEEIIPAFDEWKKRYERQGYYSTGNRERIPLEDLQHYCDIVEADEFMFKNGGQLIGNQYKIDMNKNGRIDAEDFKILRSTMNGAWRNEHKHVNHSEDWETRYARKTNSSRTGYKGRKEYGDGGEVEEFATGKLVGKGSRGKNQYNKEVDAYKWFVVSDKNHVDSGWEYKEDATDQAKELSEGKFMGSSWKVMSLVTLKKKGIADPREDWKYKYSVGGFLLGTGVGAVLGNEIAKSGVKATASKIGKGASNIKEKLKDDYADFRQASKKKK